MIQDAKLLFADAQALTSVAGSAQNGTNIIDLGADGKDAFGNAEKRTLVDGTWFVNINVALATAAKILYVDLVTGSAVASSTISSSVNIARIEFPALSPAGTKRAMRVESGKLGRYLGIEYSATATLASATVESGLIHGYNDSEIKEKFQG